MENDWFCGKCITELFPYNHLDNDVDFITASFDVSESTGKSLCYLFEKLFVPFELNDQDHTSFLTDADPDIHFYNTFNQSSVECNYYLETTFNNDLDKTKGMREVLSLCHMNIRSVRKNLDSFENYLNLLNHKFTVIGLSETWLSNDDYNLYGLSGYNFIGNHRSDRIGGGVAICLKENIAYTMRDDLSRFDDDIESICIEIEKDQNGCHKNFVIEVIYHPPNQDLKHFAEKVNDLVHSLKSEKKRCYLLGDYNVNLLNYDQHVPTGEFVDMLSSNVFFVSHNPSY